MRQFSKLLVLLFLIFPFALFAQTEKIEGIITNAETGEVLAGATITLSDGKSSVSDHNGHFEIVASSKSKVTFSYVGMKSVTATIPSSKSKTFNIALTPLATAIDEVVVSVYGSTTKASNNTGSFSSIKGAVVKASPYANFDAALNGHAPGLQVTTTSGLIADFASIKIRGASSISLSSQPLIVVDGVPLLDVQNVNKANYGKSKRFNPLACINSSDIESIEVLKDASAAAIYGARAGNGVILITTKKGKGGNVNITYNGTVTLSQAAKVPDLLNAEDFIEVTNEKASNWFGANTVIASPYVFNGKEAETDWMKEIFRTAFTHNHQVSVSGGTDKTSFYASASCLNQDGTVVGTDLFRYSVKANAEVRPNNWLKAGLSVNYSKSENNGAWSDNYSLAVTMAGYNAPPNTLSMINGQYNLTSDGLLGNGGNLYTYKGTKTCNNAFQHPIAINKLNRNKNTADRNIASGFIEASPFHDLKITSRIGIDNLTNLQDEYYHPSLYGVGKRSSGVVETNNLLLQQWCWANFANYEKSINNHHIGLTVGAEYTQNKTQLINAEADGFVSDYYQDILDGLFATSATKGEKSEYGYASYISRATYSYKSKYYADFSFRRDGFSGFGKDSRYGNFPGLSAAWRISEEPFLKNITTINNLKIRASWGIVGNSMINPYASLTEYGQGKYGDINGLAMKRIGNSKLHWESNQKINFGLDATLLDNSVSLSVDLFKNTVSDMLFTAPTILSSGQPGAGVTANIGKMWNRGIEVQLNTRNIQRGDFTWTTIANFTYIQNRISALAGSDILGLNSLVVGQPMGVWRLYEWAGVDPQTGRAGYYDASGKVKYYDPSPAAAQANRWTFADGSLAPSLNNADQKVFNGRTGTPKWFGNIDNSISYKNIELNIGLQYGGGFYVLNSTKSGLLTNFLNNNVSDILDRWTVKGQSTDIPKLYWGDKISLQAASTRFLEKGDFLRLRDITLTYTITKKMAEKIGFEGSIYLRGDNLAILTGYSGLDPEISTTRDYNYQAGCENRSIPLTRSFSLGVTLSF